MSETFSIKQAFQPVGCIIGQYIFLSPYIVMFLNFEFELILYLAYNVITNFIMSEYSIFDGCLDDTCVLCLLNV